MYYIYADLLIFVIKYTISLAERSNVGQKKQAQSGRKRFDFKTENIFNKV